MRVSAFDLDVENWTPNGLAVTSLVIRIFQANGRLLKTGDALSRDLGLTSTRWQVLGAIDMQPKTVAQIAREFELTRQGVLWVVEMLQKESLVELVPNPAHKRAKLVRLTSAGQHALGEVLNRQRVWADELGRSFTSGEMQICNEVLERFSELLKSEES